MIKVSATSQRNRTITCTLCGTSEINSVTGLRYEHLSLFSVSGEQDYFKFDDDITCSNCGHRDKLGHYQLASLPLNDTIHLGVSHLNDHFISRCGLVTSSVSQGSLVFKDTNDLIQASSRPCRSCEINEGATANDRKLASEEDRRVIAAFHDSCEASREQNLSILDA